MMLATIGMTVILHRQWVSNEHLPYPVAQFTSFVLGHDREEGMPRAVGSRYFWYGFVPVLLLYINNGVHVYFPGWPKIPLNINMDALGVLWPEMTVQQGAYALFNAEVHPTVIAFAYFLPGEVTFSLGISLFCGVLFGAVAMAHGIRLTNSIAGCGNIQGLQFGAYAGMALTLLYTGRQYFRRVVQAGFGLPVMGSKPESASVWWFRVMIVCLVLSVWMLTRIGLGWPFALLLVLITLLMYAVLARISAETGLFFLHSWWLPSGVLLGLLGGVCLGPQYLFVAVVASIILIIDPRECLMPFMVNAFKICEDQRIPRGRVAAISAVVLAIALAGAVVVSLMLEYNRGMAPDYWANHSVAQMAPELVNHEVETLKFQGTLEKSVSMGLLQRLRHIRPDREFPRTMAIGFLLFIACALCRLRFAWWPIHPVLFLVWYVYSMRTFAASFFLGWIVKTAVVRFAGTNSYMRYRPVAVGVIAGTLTAVLIFQLVAAIYYIQNGYSAPGYYIFPG
jgi:hypothetical protein